MPAFQALIGEVAGRLGTAGRSAIKMIHEYSLDCPDIRNMITLDALDDSVQCSASYPSTAFIH